MPILGFFQRIQWLYGFWYALHSAPTVPNTSLEHGSFEVCRHVPMFSYSVPSAYPPAPSKQQGWIFVSLFNLSACRQRMVVGGTILAAIVVRPFRPGSRRREESAHGGRSSQRPVLPAATTSPRRRAWCQQGRVLLVLCSLPGQACPCPSVQGPKPIFKFSHAFLLLSSACLMS